MAQVFDDVLNGDTTSDQYGVLEDLQNESASTVADKSVDEDLPEKYRGKTAKEIALMHQESEKVIGRQGNEVGELRRVVDDFIKTQTSQTKQTQETELDDLDFLADPKKTVKKAIDNHPAIREAQEASKAFKRTDTLTKIARKFPDFESTVADPVFAEWINGSNIRRKLFLEAETNFDFDAADELLSTWKEKQEITKRTLETSKLDRDTQLSKADVGSRGSTENVSKKKYRRSDIIKLMQTDPARYDSMSEEIMAAYREGRVI